MDHNAFDLDTWQAGGGGAVIKVGKDRDRRNSVCWVGYKFQAKLQDQRLISGSEVTSSGVCSSSLLS